MYSFDGLLKGNVTIPVDVDRKKTEKMDTLPEAERYTFFLNPYPDRRFTHCPRCGEETYKRNRVLVIQLGPSLVMPAMATCRYCPNCDLLIAHQDELVAAVRQMLPPDEQEAVSDALEVIGTVDRGRLRGGEIEGATPQEAIEAFLPIRDVVHFDLVEDEAGNVEIVEVARPYPEIGPVIPVPEISDVQVLPQQEETWQVAGIQLWTWIADEDEQLFRPYLILVISTAGPFVMYQEMMQAEPSTDQIRDALLKAMSHPPIGTGGARRPTQIVTDDTGIAETLRSELAELDIHCTAGLTPELDNVLADLEYYLAGGYEPIPGLLDDPLVTPEQVGELFEAAAEFYRYAPWEWMLDEDIIALRYPVPGGQWRFVSVMGNAGMEFGLAVFEHLSDYDMLATIPPETAAGMMDYRSLTYDEITAFPFPDLEALEYYGWEIAADDGYPIPITFAEDGELERPGPEEIEWYTVALRAVIDFVYEYWPDNIDYVPEPVSTTLIVPLAGRHVEVELKYPADLVLDEAWAEMNVEMYRFKVQLSHRKRLARHIEILSTQTLADFDAIIRDVFNHDPMDHLSGFWIAGGRWERDIELATVDPFGGGENANMLIGTIGIAKGDKLKYVYDFGDWIEHTITLEAVTEPEVDVDYPRVTD